ncbi:osmoprotectant transport system substrate-binding protein [Paenibacillus anaericanus]|uniref:ABC transporter substrate-binding protein n=1 Tax=Paenibacillus anaericanus TaxID=170367 RepID=UPI00278242E2|nr:glycine betaine ABC transporter substrate-binding protein [Paenibacillus anaericanus]MDQ0088770.1 osmoprotectant transport system substrate-binding protein [Paenibacillus anaericanus]
MNLFKKITTIRPGAWLRSSIIAGLSLVLVLAMTGCGKSASSSDTITVATKGFAESDILANAIALLIENDTKLSTKITTLDNNLLWEAIKAGDVDTYVEYTGTALLNILKEKPEYDPQKAYEIVKEKLKEKNQVEVLEQIGFNDTYALVLRKEIADKLNIKTTSELASHAGEIVFGTSQEFLKREDTWPLIQKVYDPKFKEIKTIQNNSLAYKAIEQGLIDVTDVYTTDSKIPISNFVVLEDDKHVFVPYFAIPVIREETLKNHPELKDIINKLAGKIDDAEMQKLNGEVEQKQRPAKDVAREWLKNEGLIK